MAIVQIDLDQQKYDYSALCQDENHKLWLLSILNYFRVASCIPISSNMECNLIHMIGIIVTLTKIVASVMGSRKYGIYSPCINKYELSVNLLLDYQILFCIIQICGMNEKK
jgi:hypothetical protein